MINPTIDSLCDKVKELSCTDRLFLSLSMGADSLAMFLRILETGKYDVQTGVYHYYYWMPGIPWVDDYIDYFEAKYGVKIIQTPSSIFLSDIADWNYQSPARVEAINNLYDDQDNFPYKMTKKQLVEFVRIWARLPDTAYIGIGVKQGDSARRRMQMRRMEGINQGDAKWYPIWDFENRDVIEIIKRHGLKMPYDYELFGISFENIDYRFLKVISERCPATYKKILDFAPMAKTIISRSEYYYPGHTATKGIFYKKFDCLKPVRPL